MPSRVAPERAWRRSARQVWCWRRCASTRQLRGRFIPPEGEMLDAATFCFGVGVFTLTVMLLVPSAGLTAAGRRRSRRGLDVFPVYGSPWSRSRRFAASILASPRRAARSTRPPGWSSSCPPRRTAAIDEHLDACEGCRNVLAQWRTIIDLAGRLTEADIERADPLTVDRLMSSVHGIRRR